ncbi:phosphoribosylanthranilate isomerase [Acinetobacter portensis]|uniref:N-(5'-phosphoribosyl)anthranilate isomerase n=1 Tax=Acinetobacter portensis TaxID=1839785 RepID=A0ABY4JY29_9GAMM|nr:MULTISPECIES: phosphoribosylanthranilate isomerase [Acinetobacter]MCK7608079.1 phosphoribosylanthranilate isomerase [Acinetobacter portensis]MCK7638784.1 phosphoribosylanthranilate isomerase [Acinetobacter portensis]MDY6450161.1 phosphoribosylanthranilate isomerase [Acinetobacter faecalis]MDY6456365.1 phosphoribosylanthranilate isomerase [Acinetobacter faecalis]MDY6459230.1 phosphoribosylanthranilate isomerase [Acinetobacter faecalis]
MRTRVKICGITRTQDIKSVVDAGADAIGFVFFPPSPRNVSVKLAEELVKHVPAYVQTVGLFVNASSEEILEVLKTVSLDVLQFHGDETPEQCQKIAKLTGRRWYKAIQVKPDLDVISTIKQYQQVGASAMLLDAWHPELKGGTGHSFDWSQFPQLDIPLILAGGLKPENIENAIKTTKAYAVDVSGGVESAKGIKDQQLIEQFMQGVHRGSAK